jgi:hypothetical protein
VLRLGRAVLHLAAQEAQRLGHDGRVVGVDRRQARHEMLGDAEVVEPGELDVVGHAQPGVVQAREGAHRHLVRDREHAVHLQATGQRPGEHAARLRDRVGRQREHERGVRRQAGVLERLGPALLARGRHLRAVRGEPAAQHRDPPGAAGDQVLGGEPRPGDVVHPDAVVPLGHGLLAEENDRHVGMDPVQVREVEPDGAQQHAVVLLEPGQRERGELPLAARARLLHDQVHALRRQRLRDPGGQLAVVVRVELRHDEADRAGPPRPQPAGGQVDLVPELVDDLEHPQPRVRAHVRPAVEHVRHGHHRDARLASHVAHRDHPFPSHDGSLCQVARGSGARDAARGARRRSRNGDDPPVAT